MKYNNRGVYNSPITEIASNGISRKRDNEDDDFLGNVISGNTGSGASGDTGNKGQGKTETDEEIAARQQQEAAQAEAERVEAERLEAERLANNGNSGDGGSGTGNNNPTDVTVDNVKYTLDKDGNALDADKKVVYTADQLKAFEGATEDDDDEPIVNSIIKTFGVEIKDEAGTPKVYEDTVEGISQYVQDLVPVLVKEGADKFLETNQKVKAYYQHLALGKDDNSFFNTVKESWKNFKFDDKNPVQHKEIIKKYLVGNGLDEESALTTADALNTSGKASEAAKKYLDLLVTKETEFEAKLDEEYNTRVAEATEKRTKYWKDVEEIVVKKGQFADFIIPANDRMKFYEYLAKPLEDGKSQDQIDQETDPLEVELQLAFLRFKKFKLDELVKRTQQSNNTKTLSSKIKKRKHPMTGGKTDTGTGGNKNVDIGLEQLY